MSRVWLDVGSGVRVSFLKKKFVKESLLFTLLCKASPRPSDLRPSYNKKSTKKDLLRMLS